MHYVATYFLCFSMDISIFPSFSMANMNTFFLLFDFNIVIKNLIYLLLNWIYTIECIPKKKKNMLVVSILEYYYIFSFTTSINRKINN